MKDTVGTVHLEGLLLQPLITANVARVNGATLDESLTAGLSRARRRIDHHIRMRAVISDETGTIDIEAIVERE